MAVSACGFDAPGLFDHGRNRRAHGHSWQPVPFSGTEVYSLSTDSAGKFLFVCAANNDQVQVFSINQTSGALAPVAHLRLQVLPHRLRQTDWASIFTSRKETRAVMLMCTRSVPPGS